MIKRWSILEGTDECRICHSPHGMHIVHHNDDGRPGSNEGCYNVKCFFLGPIGVGPCRYHGTPIVVLILRNTTIL